MSFSNGCTDPGEYAAMSNNFNVEYNAAWFVILSIQYLCICFVTRLFHTLFFGGSSKTLSALGKSYLMRILRIWTNQLLLWLSLVYNCRFAIFFSILSFDNLQMLPIVMFRLSPIIDCRSIIAKNSDYRSKISKIDHRKQIIYEMRNGENRMHSVRIGYYLKYGGAHRLE